MNRLPAIAILALATVAAGLGALLLGERASSAPGAQPPLPVQEQNLDADGNLKVHEQGTADVNVTNTSLSVAPSQPVTRGGGSVSISACPDEAFPQTVIASALRINWSSTITGVNLLHGIFVVASFVGPSGGDESAVDLALTRPVTFDRIQCFGAGGASVSWVGNEP